MKVLEAAAAMGCAMTRFPVGEHTKLLSIICENGDGAFISKNTRRHAIKKYAKEAMLASGFFKNRILFTRISLPYLNGITGDCATWTVYDEPKEYKP